MPSIDPDRCQPHRRSRAVPRARRARTPARARSPCAARRCSPRRRISGCSTRAARPTGSTPTRGVCCAFRVSSSKASGCWRRCRGPSRCSDRPAPRSSTPDYETAAAGGRHAGPRRMGGHHRRRPGLDGGGEPGLPGGRRPLDRARHRAAVRAGAQPVGRSRRELPLLLRAQDDVRQVRPGVRDPARRLRHHGRTLRGPHARADPEGDPLSGGADGYATTGAGCWTGYASRWSAPAGSARRTWNSSPSPTTSRRCSPSSTRVGSQ